MFTAEQMLVNAATASQHFEVCADPVVKGALLRSMAQFIRMNETLDGEELIELLKKDYDYNS